jgi:hypothetical protein
MVENFVRFEETYAFQPAFAGTQLLASGQGFWD